MHEKYNSIITNDIYLAAYLDSTGFTLVRVHQNDRRRTSFVFTGAYIEKLRDAYNTGTVTVNFRIYKDSLARMRWQKDKIIEQRSDECPHLYQNELSEA
jgi:hypothetical protein